MRKSKSDDHFNLSHPQQCFLSFLLQTAECFGHKPHLSAPASPSRWNRPKTIKTNSKVTTWFGLVSVSSPALAGPLWVAPLRGCRLPPGARGQLGPGGLPLVAHGVLVLLFVKLHKEHEIIWLLALTDLFLVPLAGVGHHLLLLFPALVEPEVETGLALQLSGREEVGGPRHPAEPGEGEGKPWPGLQLHLAVAATPNLTSSPVYNSRWLTVPEEEFELGRVEGVAPALPRLHAVHLLQLEAVGVEPLSEAGPLQPQLRCQVVLGLPKHATVRKLHRH